MCTTEEKRKDAKGAIEKVRQVYGQKGPAEEASAGTGTKENSCEYSSCAEGEFTATR